MKDQEKGMNELTVDEYRENRENRFIDKGAAIEGNVAHQTAREEAYVLKRLPNYREKDKSLMKQGRSEGVVRYPSCTS